MENLKVYLDPCGMPKWCRCSVSRNDFGEIVLPDLTRCMFKASAHKEAIERATFLLTNCPKREIENLPRAA